MNHLKPFLRRTLISAFLATIGVAMFLSPARAWTTDPYTWGTVAVGGGGACPQLVIHPKVIDVMYLSSDVGGLHRWDPVNQKWISLLDFMRFNTDDNNQSCASVAVDPSDATGNIVWAACGLYDWTKGEVMKSTDRGNTWTRNSKGMFYWLGNGDQGHRQRLAVDPKNGNVCYAASRDALYRTADGGVTWTKLTSAPTGDITKLGTGSGSCGNQVVIIDPSSATLSSPTRAARVYIGPLGSPVYKTEDGGTTWSAMSGAPTSINYAAVSPTGVFYCTNGSGIYKYTGGASGTWSTTTPAAGSYGNIAIDPFNSNNLLVIQQVNFQSTVWHSADAGASWPTAENTANDSVTYNPPWYYGNWFAAYMDGVQYDPFRQGVVWENDLFAAFKTANINAAPPHWDQFISGHEEIDVTCALISPPSGPTLLYSGCADVQGFRHTSLTGWPTRIQISYNPGQNYKNLTGADFEEANPNFAAFVGIDSWSGPGAGGYTTDGGVTFHDFTSGVNVPANYGGRIAVSATGTTMVWAASSDNPAARFTPSYSTDTGATWHTCTGAPGINLGYNLFNWNSPLCSDRKNGAKFYIYNDNGTFFRSTDTGHTFTQVASGLPADGNKAQLIADFTTEGSLWLSLEGSGLYHSTDSGSTWTHLANVQSAYMVTVGKGPNATTPSIYIMGMVDSDTNEGVFRSDNGGTSWFKVDITWPYPGRGPNFMCGDRQTYGTVYVGTNIGIYYGQRGSFVPPAPGGLTATAGNAQVALSWTASSGATSYNVKRSTVNGSGYVTVSSPTTTSYTNTGLTNGTTYYYVVTAVNTSGESGNSNQASATPSAPLQAQIIAGTATIDGVAEAAWNSATAYSLTKTTGTITNGADCSATWKGMWDATNLYILVSVTDDAKINDSVNVFDDDAVELYLDADDNGGTGYDANDRQILCGWGDAAPVEGGGRAIAGAAFAKTDPTGTAYIIEVKIPWAVEAFTPAANAVIGIDVHVDDDDDGGVRDGKLIWNDGTDQAWTNPSLFGTGKLNALPAPPAPTGLTATAGNAQVALSWTASSGATAYDVKRSTVNGSGYVTVSSPTTTSYTNTGLTNGTTYYFVVDAKNAGGASGNSNQASATPAVSVPQAKIAGGTATIDGVVEAAWSSATVYPLNKTTGTISGASDCSATWKGMWDATNLYILASVTDDAKINDSTNTYDDDAVEIYLDADHNGGTVYDANDRQILCGWGDPNPVEGGARAIVGAAFAKTDPTGTTYVIEAKIPWAIEAFTPAANAIIGIDVHIDDDDDGGVRDGKVIWNDGTDQAWTNPSLFGTGKLIAGPPPAPTGLAAVPTDTQIALTWNASTGATTYNVYRGTSAGGESGTAIASGIATTSYTNTGLTDGTNYFYTVKAVNAVGTSGASNEASGIPAQYNFESGVQGWTFYSVPAAGVAQSSTQAFGPTHSLAVTLNGAAGDGFTYVSNPAATAGKVITCRVWIPTGSPLLGISPYIQDQTWVWTGNWYPIANLTQGAWNTVTLTVPAAAGMPLNRLGVQFTTSTTWSGTCYVDSVSW